MTHTLFERHQPLLDQALKALADRGYWSAFPESPSPKVYGEGAAEAGKAAFDALLDKPFPLTLPGATTMVTRTNPYRAPLCARTPTVYHPATRGDPASAPVASPRQRGTRCHRARRSVCSVSPPRKPPPSASRPAQSTGTTKAARESGFSISRRRPATPTGRRPTAYRPSRNAARRRNGCID